MYDQKLTIIKFQDFPVHLTEEQKVNFSPDQIYKVKIENLNDAGNSFQVTVLNSFGKIGDYEIEKKIYEKYFNQKYFAEWDKSEGNSEHFKG